MSEARTHRKAAQGTAAKVVELVKGVSGLSASEKSARLADALKEARATVEHLEAAASVSPVKAKGEARKFRKQVQTLAADLSATVKGKSGLDAAGKKAALEQAHATAVKIVEATESALAAV